MSRAARLRQAVSVESLARVGGPGQIGGLAPEGTTMPQTRGQIFDDISRIMSDAAGLADSARREVETLARAQIERILSSMNVVSREEFEAVREMAIRARDENERLVARIAALEARGGGSAGGL